MAKDIIVKLIIPVTLYDRKYVAGEPIKNPPKDLFEAWKENKLIMKEPEESNTEPELDQASNPKAERVTAEGAIGIPEDGTGVEGQMPGRDSRKKVK